MCVIVGLMKAKNQKMNQSSINKVKWVFKRSVMINSFLFARPMSVNKPNTEVSIQVYSRGRSNTLKLWEHQTGRKPANIFTSVQIYTQSVCWSVCWSAGHSLNPQTGSEGVDGGQASGDVFSDKSCLWHLLHICMLQSETYTKFITLCTSKQAVEQI